MEKKQNEIIKLFVRFLKDNNSYFKFKKNFLTYHNNGFLTYHDNGVLANYIINNEPYYYFTGAFLWSSTKESANYWKIQNALWRKQLLM